MSAEPRQTTAAEAWSQWLDRTVQGRFVLRRCLGWSDYGAVFLTEHKAKNLTEAAIKFVRADAPQAQPLLVQWQAAVNLSHPHLVQLFEVGRWQAEGQDYLFVVMEYGDQTLAEILRRRPLSAEEVQELLPPVLEALTFLHRRQLVHSQLKPTNFLAVGDQLKLASDTTRPAGQDHGTSTAGDVWSFGATLLEALTARARISSDQRFDVSSLPAGLPPALVDTVRRCLSPSPADRPSVIELRAENKPGAPAAGSAAKPETVSQVASPTAPAARPETVSQVAPQPSQTSSRVAVSFQPPAARSDLPATTSTQPVSSPSRETAALRVVQTASRVSVSFLPAPPSPPRDTAPPQSANTASQAASAAKAPPTSQPVAPPPPNAASRTSQAVPAPESARSDSRATASAAVQPASNISRSADSASLPSAASRVTPSAQALPITLSSSQQVASPTAAPRISHKAVPPQVARSDLQVAAPARPVQNISRPNDSSQTASPASGEAAPAEAVPNISPPIDATQSGTASGGASLPQPVPNTVRDSPQLQPASVTPRAAAAAQPASNAGRDHAQPEHSNAAPRVASTTQPAPNAHRDNAHPEPSNAAPRVASTTQPAPNADRDNAQVQPAITATRVAASAQSSQSSAREVTPPQAANAVAARVALLARLAPGSSRENTTQQPANTQPQVSSPAQFSTNAQREVISPRPGPGSSSDIGRDRTALGTPSDIARDRPALGTSNGVVHDRPAPGTSNEDARDRPATSTSNVLARHRPPLDISNEDAQAESGPKRHILGIAAGAALLVIAVWIGLRSPGDAPAPLQPAAAPTPVPTAAPEHIAENEPPLSTSDPEAEQPAPVPTSSASVLNEVLPDVPEKIQSKIQGRIYVTVRVLVDPTGKVIGVLEENAGPSKYFARISDRAARQWQFVPAETDEARVWSLRFEYTRDGVSVRTV